METDAPAWIANELGVHKSLADHIVGERQNWNAGRREWPCGRRAAEQRDERAAFHVDFGRSASGHAALNGSASRRLDIRRVS